MHFMNQKNIVPIAVSTLAGALAALAVCAFFFFYYEPAQEKETSQKPVIVNGEASPTPAPRKTEVPMPPEREIKESEVLSLNIDTTYKGFFDENSKCRKSYNEMFNGRENDSDANSACSVNLTFERDGSAGKKLVIRRYDGAVKNWVEAETSVWRSKISGEQFRELANSIVNNEAFKNWNEMISINTRNCKITVKHANGAKSPMSNVGAAASAFLPMIDAFKDLDGKITWEKVQ
jgi:hypothetical protein